MNNSIKFYQGTGYGEINDFLRQVMDERIIEDNTSDPTVKHIKNIDRIMKNNNLKNVIVYRGIKMSLLLNLKNMSSNVLVNKGYTSSSLDIEKSKMFTDENCILRFIIPNNLKTHIYEYKKNISENLNEKEILIQRNTQFVINDMEDIKENKIYDAVLSNYIPPKSIRNLNNLEKLKNEMMQKMLEEDFSDSDFED